MRKAEYVFIILQKTARISMVGIVERKGYYSSISCCLSCADVIWAYRAFLNK